MRRAPPAEALSQLTRVRSVERLAGAVETASEPTAVLNENRQVVFANRAFQDLVGAETIENLCGKRPGEVLGCVNAGEGCGESEPCRFCGAALAIIETFRSRAPVRRECHISASDGGRSAAHDFLVHTTPFDVGGSAFVLIGLTDVSHQKRRLALERIFFHDILNTVSSFKVHLDLLKREAVADRGRDLIVRLEGIFDMLVEEIQGQRVLVSAENGTLSVQKDLVESHALARLLTDQLMGQDVARGRRIMLAPFSESFSFVSDDSLLKRVLGNMLKNALEATPDGGTITLGFFRKDGRALFQVHNPGGMETAVQRQVFTRYFSTKGEGRGLGTWGMKLLAEDYLGGTVSFTSSKEDGTTFTLSLPQEADRTGFARAKAISGCDCPAQPDPQ